MNKFNQGMTFIELVLVITILGATTFVAVPMIDNAIQAWSFVIYRSELWQTGELAMSRMTQDVREVRGADDVLTANAQTLIFIKTTGEAVTYSFSGSTITRNGNALLANVSAFIFSYFDAAGNQIANPRVYPTTTDLRLVRIYLVMGPTGKTFVLQTDVQPRNIY